MFERLHLYQAYTDFKLSIVVCCTRRLPPIDTLGTRLHPASLSEYQRLQIIENKKNRNEIRRMRGTCGKYGQGNVLINIQAGGQTEGRTVVSVRQTTHVVPHCGAQTTAP